MPCADVGTRGRDLERFLATLAGRPVQPHPTTSDTAHGNSSSEYAIHSGKTNPEQAITCRKGTYFIIEIDVWILLT
jgi:hypothetical protein